MRILFIPLIALFQFHLAGCAGNMPMTAQEYRLAVPGSSFAEVEKFEVNRPYDGVADTFKRMAAKCLDVTIKTSSQSPGSYQVIVANWNPTVIVGRDKAEFHLQRVYE